MRPPIARPINELISIDRPGFCYIDSGRLTVRERSFPTGG